MTDPGNSGQVDAQRAQERRRTVLPQPDFTPYKRANAYPGPGYFFVGHSYDVALSNADSTGVSKRTNAICSCFNEQAQWIPVQQALDNQAFCEILSRFEHDLLHRLPETALIGTAIDASVELIGESFTVWRQERRKPRTESSDQLR